MNRLTLRTGDRFLMLLKDPLVLGLAGGNEVLGSIKGRQSNAARNEIGNCQSSPDLSTRLKKQFRVSKDTKLQVR